MKKIIYSIIILLLLLSEGLVYSQPTTSVESLWDQIKGNIEFKNSDVYSIDSVYGANQIITLIVGAVNTPNFDSKIFFINDKPGAFWGHPCRIIFCDPWSLKFKTVAMNFPPKNLNRMKLLTPKRKAVEGKLFDYSSFKKMGKLKSDTQLKSGEATLGTDYAVIISGGSVDGQIGNSILNSCEAVYSALANSYGYTNIYTLIGSGKNFGKVWVDYPASLENISKVFDELKTKVTSNDRVFIYCMDHGDQTSDKNSFMVIYNDLLFDYSLAAEVNKLSACCVSVFMGQCNSGGFIDNLSNDNRIIATACDWNQLACATPDILYSEFTYHFVSAITGKTPSGAVVNADENSDGYVSLREAFYYAKDHDRFFTFEDPQYNSRPARLGKITTLNNSNATVNLPTTKTTTNFTFRSSTLNRDNCNPIKNDPGSFSPLFWKVSHGSPSLDPLYDIINLEAESPPNYNDRKGEGIFINFRFLGGHKYTFEFNGDDDYYGSIPSGYINTVALDVRAANNLSPSTYEECDKEKIPEVPATCDNVQTPDCSTSKVIYWSFAPHGILPNELGSETTDFTFGQNDKFTQLWLSANQKVGYSIGRVMLSHVGITDHGVYVPESAEQTAYTPVPPTSPNVIFGNQSGTGSLDPYLLIGNPLPTSFQWKQSFDQITWQDISNATDRNYDPPVLNKTTYFKRIANGYPESNIVEIAINPLPDNCSNGEPFDCNKSYWSVSHGNPIYSTDKYMGSYIGLNWDFYITATGINNYRESDGVYLSYKFEKGKEYTISFYFYDKCNGSSGGNLHLFAASNIHPHPGNRKEVETNADKKEKIWDGINDSYWKKVTLKYLPNDNYNSLWFYPSGDWNEYSCDGENWTFLISNVAIMLEQNIVGPTTVSGIVYEKGKVITTSGETIINTGADVTFIAHEKILLEPGFKTLSGSHFYGVSKNIYVECPGGFYDYYGPFEFKADEINMKSPAKPEVTVFPNPCDDIFTIETKNFNELIEKVEIYNSRGTIQRIITDLGNSTITIDMSNDPSGTYFVRIICKSSVYNRKLIKL